MKYLRNFSSQRVATILTMVFIFALALVPLVAVQAQDGIFGGVNPPDQLYQPGNRTLAQTAQSILQVVLSVVGLVALAYLIYGGFKYMSAGGDEEKVGAAKKTIINALIGLVVIILSYAIVSLVFSFVKSGGQIQ